MDTEFQSHISVEQSSIQASKLKELKEQNISNEASINVEGDILNVCTRQSTQQCSSNKSRSKTDRSLSAVSELSKTYVNRFYNLDVRDVQVSDSRVAFIRASRDPKSVKKKKTMPAKEIQQSKFDGRLAKGVECSASFQKRHKDLIALIENLWHVGFTFKELGLIMVS